MRAFVTGRSVYGFFNIRPADTPTIRMMDLATTDTFAFTQPVAEDSLSAFLDDILSGSIKVGRAGMDVLWVLTARRSGRASRKPRPRTGMPDRSSC